MRRPPSPAEIPAYPVTAGVGLLAIAVTLITGFGKKLADRLAVAPQAFGREPWRLVTAALPHLDVFHLVFNVYWLWVFGTLLEETLGHVRLLGLIVLFSAGSMAAEYAFTQGGYGLSGVGYGLFALLWVLSRRDRRFHDAVDSRTAQLFGFWFVLCVALTWRGLWRVANVAHGVGAVLGALVGLTMAAKSAGRRAGAAAALLLVLAGSLAGGSVFRPRLNRTRDNYRQLQSGYQATQEGRFEEAILHYRSAIAIDPQSSIAWYNLGYTYDAAGRVEDAIEPFRRAYQIDPVDSRHRKAVFSTSRRGADKARERGDHARAAELLRGALEIDPNDSFVWLDLAFEYDALGKAAEAAEAREKSRALAPRP